MLLVELAYIGYIRDLRWSKVADDFPPATGVLAGL